MKIGMVTACYKPVVNGVTHMVSLYKSHLEAMGHDVTIFTMGEPDPAGEEPGVVRTPGLALGDTGYHITARFSPEVQARLREMDIIHCHHLFMSVEMAHRYGRCPIVYTNHTRYDLYTHSRMALPQPAVDAVMRQIWPEFTDFADVVITPSASVHQVMLDFGVTRPIEVIENGVDLRPFQENVTPICRTELGVPPDAPLFVYLGRLAAEKNPKQLLAQFAVAADIVPDAHLLLVGDGPALADLQQWTATRRLSDRIHFAGSVAYNDVPRYLAAADIFATASQTEVHPLTVIEALAAGLPVVGIQAPGILDTVVNGRTGLLTTMPDGGLAAAMVALASNPARRVEMAAAARADSLRFDIRHTVASTVALYEKLWETRPDLQRRQVHGRWLRSRDRWQPFVDQLSGLLGAGGEKRGTGPLRWLAGERGDEREREREKDAA